MVRMADETEPHYPEFIDLLREARIAGFGKIGPTYIPMEDVECIAPQERIEAYLEQLHTEGVLIPIKGSENLMKVVERSGRPMIELNSAKTAEEIETYKLSLHGITPVSPMSFDDLVLKFDRRTVTLTIGPYEIPLGGSIRAAPLRMQVARAVFIKRTRQNNTISWRTIGMRKEKIQAVVRSINELVRDATGIQSPLLEWDGAGNIRRNL